LKKILGEMNRVAGEASSMEGALIEKKASFGKADRSSPLGSDCKFGVALRAVESAGNIYRQNWHRRLIDPLDELSVGRPKWRPGSCTEQGIHQQAGAIEKIRRKLGPEKDINSKGEKLVRLMSKRGQGLRMLGQNHSGRLVMVGQMASDDQTVAAVVSFTAKNRYCPSLGKVGEGAVMEKMKDLLGHSRSSRFHEFPGR
jgi:hypothetical protein